MTQSIEEKKSQIAALQQQVDIEQQAADNLGQFRKDDGAVMTDPTEINDALLRAAGLAMQERVKTLDWQAMNADALHDALDQARAAEDFTGVALYAAALNAQKAMGA